MFIRDSNCFHPGSVLNNLSILTPKKWFLSSRKYDPGCSYRILDPDLDFLPILDPGSRDQKNTGSRIPDPDPHHSCKLIINDVEIIACN
jgi:hypothetical protein